MEGLLTDKAAVFSSLLDDVGNRGNLGPARYFGERLNELQPLLATETLVFQIALVVTAITKFFEFCASWSMPEFACR